MIVAILCDCEIVPPECALAAVANDRLWIYIAATFELQLYFGLNAM